MTALAPEWFTRAIATPTRSHVAAVDGVAIHYLTWNEHDTEKPALIFAHGFFAHARWWSFIAPFFVERFRVFAIDFSGMGDSGSRTEYEMGQFTRDIVGVIEHVGLKSATLVGHSFGGARVIRTCADASDYVSRAIVIDSHLRFADEEPVSRRPPLGPRKLYPTLAAAKARFRLIPEDNCAAPYVLDYIAQHSLKQTPTGEWCWKFDDKLAVPMERDSGPILARVHVPITYVYGEYSKVVDTARVARIMTHLPHARGPVVIPEAHHHVMLDQPLSLVSALRGILY